MHLPVKIFILDFIYKLSKSKSISYLKDEAVTFKRISEDLKKYNTKIKLITLGGFHT